MNWFSSNECEPEFRSEMALIESRRNGPKCFKVENWEFKFEIQTENDLNRKSQQVRRIRSGLFRSFDLVAECSRLRVQSENREQRIKISRRYVRGITPLECMLVRRQVGDLGKSKPFLDYAQNSGVPAAEDELKSAAANEWEFGSIITGIPSFKLCTASRISSGNPCPLPATCPPLSLTHLL